MSASVIASVSGSSIANRVPWPATVSSVSVPPSSCTVVLTTAMPTPRPLARSAASRVENPGAQRMSSSASSLEVTVRDGQARRPRARGHRPGVDAAAVVADLEDHRVADGGRAERERALAGLPAARRSAERLEAVADRVADQVQDRIHHPLDQELVDLGVLSGELEPDPLVGISRARSRTTNGMRRKISPTGTRRTRITPSRRSRSWRSMRQAVLLHGAPLDRRHVALDARQRIGSRARVMTRSPISRISSSSRARSTRTKCDGGAARALSGPPARCRASPAGLDPPEALPAQS